MREILFRGKRLDTGEWIEGAFLNDRDGAFYICPAATDITYGDNGNRRRIGCWYAVDPKTVGQYTGLKDRNGKRIFEGGCINHPLNVVEYSNGEFCVSGDRPLWLMARYGEVIGNTNDNPELMEGGNG